MPGDAHADAQADRHADTNRTDHTGPEGGGPHR